MKIVIRALLSAVAILILGLTTARPQPSVA